MTDEVSVKRCGQANHRSWPRHWYDDSLEECDVEIADFRDSGVEAQEKWYREVYIDTLIQDPGPPPSDGSWLSEAFGDLFGGPNGVWRRDATWVLWACEGQPDLSFRIFDDDLDRFLGEIEEGAPGIFVLVPDPD